MFSNLVQIQMYFFVVFAKLILFYGLYATNVSFHSVTDKPKELTSFRIITCSYETFQHTRVIIM